MSTSDGSLDEGTFPVEDVSGVIDDYFFEGYSFILRYQVFPDRKSKFAESIILKIQDFKITSHSTVSYYFFQKL